MQAVILCGGLGTRLKELTQNTPKPMVLVHGKPFLEYQVEMLKHHGFKKFLFLTGYLGNQIEDFFRDEKKWGTEMRFSRELSPVGTGGALKLAEPLLEDQFFLLNGDSFLDMDYAGLARDFRASGCWVDMAVYPDVRGETGVIPNVRWDAGTRRVTSYQKDAGGDHTCVDAGVTVVSRKVFSLFPASPIFSFEKEVYPVLIEKKLLAGFESPNRFYDIGTFDRLSVFAQVLK